MYSKPVGHHGEFLLHCLDGEVGGNVDAIDAVLVGAGAATASDGLVVDKGVGRLGAEAHAVGAVTAGFDALLDGAGEGEEEGVGNLGGDFVAGAEGGRVFAVDEAAIGGDDPYCAFEARVGLYLRVEDGAENPEHDGNGAVVGHVDAELGGAAGAGIVDLDGGLGFVADGDLDADGDGLVGVHIVVQVVEGFVVALGKGEDAVPGFDLGHVKQPVEGLGEGGGVVLGGQFLHAASAEHEGAHVGADVALPVVGIADVQEDDVEDVLLDFAGLLEADGGKAQALLVDFRGVAEGGLAGGFAAYVGPVAGVSDKGDELALVEDGGDESNVGEVGWTAAVGVVDNKDVAFVEGLLRVAFAVEPRR